MHAKPVAAGLTFLVDALNRPAGQILHVGPPEEVRIHGGVE
jgi:hypothetical protein